jgi:hypothetical protein
VFQNSIKRKAQSQQIKVSQSNLSFNRDLFFSSFFCQRKDCKNKIEWLECEQAEIIADFSLDIMQ